MESDSKYSVRNIGFCTLYFIWVFIIHIAGSQYFTQLNGDLIQKSVNAVVLILLIMCFLFNYKINKQLCLDIFIFFSFSIGFLFSHHKGILIFLFIFMVRNVPFRLIVTTFLFATVSGMLFIFVTYIFNLYPETYLDLFRNDDTYRNLLGYRFPTFLPNFFFHIMLCICFLRKERFSILEALFLYVVNYYLYKYTDTRAVYYLVNLLIITMLVMKWCRLSYKTKFIGIISAVFTKYSFLLFATIAIIFQVIYTPDIYILDKLNTAFSGRLSHGHWGMELYGIKLFGNDVKFTTMLEADEYNSFFYIDSAYMQLLLIYGLIIFLFFLFKYTQILKNITERNLPYFGLAMFFLFWHSVTDPQLLSPEFNPFLLTLGYYGLDKYKRNLFR